MYGCTRDEQKEELKKLGHPRAKVWYAPTQQLVHPDTGKVAESARARSYFSR